MDGLEQEVRLLVCEALELPSIDDVAGSDDLQQSGMDSLNCIALIVGIEEHFGLEVSDEQLGLQYVDTIDHICELIKEYMQYPGGSDQNISSNKERA